MYASSDSSNVYGCVSVIIAAGGLGTRMGLNINKNFIDISGEPILLRTIRAFEQHSAVHNIILVSSSAYLKEVHDIARNFNKVRDIVVGGKERQDSVYNGLNSLPRREGIVLVHDSVRPFVSFNVIRRVILAAGEFGAAIAGIRVKNTIKSVDDLGYVCSTPDRKTLWSIQTPQAFRYDIIKKAYEKALEDKFYGTDDSMLVERMGYLVKVVEGDYSNIKITTIEDIKMAEAILHF